MVRSVHCYYPVQISGFWEHLSRNHDRDRMVKNGPDIRPTRTEYTIHPYLSRTVKVSVVRTTTSVQYLLTTGVVEVFFGEPLRDIYSIYLFYLLYIYLTKRRIRSTFIIGSHKEKHFKSVHA